MSDVFGFPFPSRTGAREQIFTVLLPLLGRSFCAEGRQHREIDLLSPFSSSSKLEKSGNSVGTYLEPISEFGCGGLTNLFFPFLLS